MVSPEAAPVVGTCRTTEEQRLAAGCGPAAWCEVVWAER